MVPKPLKLGICSLGFRIWSPRVRLVAVCTFFGLSTRVEHLHSWLRLVALVLETIACSQLQSHVLLPGIWKLEILRIATALYGFAPVQSDSRDGYSEAGIPAWCPRIGGDHLQSSAIYSQFRSCSKAFWIPLIQDQWRELKL
jgi:hypothetical protein